MEDNKTVNQGNTQETEQSEGQQAERTFTQDDVNRIVGERLARVKADADKADVYRQERDTYRQERDTAREELEQYKNDAFLKAQGVMERYRDYVIFEAEKRMDDRTDFRKAVSMFLKENPQFSGRGMMVVSTGTTDGSGYGSPSSTMYDPAGIREAMGLKG